MLVMTPGEHGPQGLTSRVREQEDAAAIIGARLVWGHCEDGSIPVGREAVSLIDAVVRQVRADVIYAHAPDDTHQDHVATSAAALSAGRRLERVLFYQSPSTTSFDPTVFVDVEATLSGKLAALRAHWSQVMQCSMVDLEEIEVGARYWGSRAKVCYAEAFESPRFVWDICAPAARETSVADSDTTGVPRSRPFRRDRPRRGPGHSRAPARTQRRGAVDVPLPAGGPRLPGGVGGHRDIARRRHGVRQRRVPRLLPAPRRVLLAPRSAGHPTTSTTSPRSTWSTARTSASWSPATTRPSSSSRWSAASRRCTTRGPGSR